LWGGTGGLRAYNARGSAVSAVGKAKYSGGAGREEGGSAEPHEAGWRRRRRPQKHHATARASGRAKGQNRVIIEGTVSSWYLLVLAPVLLV